MLNTVDRHVHNGFHFIKRNVIDLINGSLDKKINRLVNKMFEVFLLFTVLTLCFPHYAFTYTIKTGFVASLYLFVLDLLTIRYNPKAVK